MRGPGWTGTMTFNFADLTYVFPKITPMPACYLLPILAAQTYISLMSILE